MTVFVVQESLGKNISGAGEYGELKVLLPPGQVAFSPGPTVRIIRQRLRNFCDEDYLIPIGDPAAIGIAFALAAHFNQGRFNVLKWDRQERLYIPIKVDIHGKSEY